MTLVYKEFGLAENQPLVLLHPFPFDSQIWHEVADQLSTKYFVITPDFPGCGKSALSDAPPSIEFVATEVYELITKFSFPNVVLGGISLGGYVAMQFAKKYPELLTGLILLDTKASSDSAATQAHRLKVASQMRSHGKVELFADQMLPNLLGEFTQANRLEVLSQVKHWIVGANPLAIAWLQEAMASRPDSLEVLKKLEIPVLLMRGTQDKISTYEDFMEMKNKLRQVTYVEISNTGHLPPVEDPIATFSAIDNWLTTFVSR